MKQVTIAELAEIVNDNPNYNFTIGEKPEDNKYYCVWADVIADLVEWCCGNYNYCLETYIHIFNDRDKYLETYCICPIGTEINDLKCMCDNWDRL